MKNFLKKIFTGPEPDEVFVPTPPEVKPKKRTPKAKKETSATEVTDVPVKKKRTSKAKKETPVENPAKVAATAAGEPWVEVTGVELDLDNIGSGNFLLDWNDIFVAKLVKAGYTGNNDVQIVDQWFTSLCRSIAVAEFEQVMADPEKRAQFANK